MAELEKRALHGVDQSVGKNKGATASTQARKHVLDTSTNAATASPVDRPPKRTLRDPEEVDYCECGRSSNATTACDKNGKRCRCVRANRPCSTRCGPCRSICMNKPIWEKDPTK